MKRIANEHIFYLYCATSDHLDFILMDWQKIAMKWLFGWRFIVINAEGEAWYIDVKPDAKVKPVGKNKDGK